MRTRMKMNQMKNQKIKTMKFTWGTGIAMAFTLFAVAMISLVSLCMQQPPDLVSEDYYARELAFQHQIDHASNTAKLSSPLLISYNATLEKVTVVFPNEMANKLITGTLHFFKPDNSELDFQVTLTSGQDLTQQIATSKMKSGLWHVKANWSADEVGYYQEESIVIN